MGFCRRAKRSSRREPPVFCEQAENGIAKHATGSKNQNSLFFGIFHLTERFREFGRVASFSI